MKAAASGKGRRTSHERYIKNCFKKGGGVVQTKKRKAKGKDTKVWCWWHSKKFNSRTLGGQGGGGGVSGFGVFWGDAPSALWKKGKIEKKTRGQRSIPGKRLKIEVKRSGRGR